MTSENQPGLNELILEEVKMRIINWFEECNFIGQLQSESNLLASGVTLQPGTKLDYKSLKLECHTLTKEGLKHHKHHSISWGIAKRVVSNSLHRNFLNDTSRYFGGTISNVVVMVKYDQMSGEPIIIIEEINLTCPVQYKVLNTF